MIDKNEKEYEIGKLYDVDGKIMRCTGFEPGCAFLKKSPKGDDYFCNIVCKGYPQFNGEDFGCCHGGSQHPYPEVIETTTGLDEIEARILQQIKKEARENG